MEHRKHALAFGCNILRRCESDDRKGGSTKPEYHSEMVFKYIKNNRVIAKNKKIVDEKETICDRSGTGTSTGRSIEFLKNSNMLRLVKKNHSCVCRILLLFSDRKRWRFMVKYYNRV